MAYTIQDFYRVASNKDFARLFQFRVTKFGSIKFTNDQLTYIETTSLPGRTINNIQVPYMGLNFNLPGTVSYPGSTGYQVTFRCDESYDIRAALEAEMFSTFDEKTSSGDYSLPKSDRILVMELFDKNFQVARQYTLFGCYIQALGDLQYDIKDNGALASVQATIAYQFWRSGASGSQGSIDTAYSRWNVERPWSASLANPS